MIKKLVRLQELDSEIDSMNEEIAATPDKVAALDGEITAAGEELKKKEDGFKQLGISQKNLENDLAKLEEEIKKSKTELYSVKTNEMYKQVLAGIEEKKAKVSDTESELLVLMDRVETARGEFESAKAALKSTTEELKKKQKAAGDRKTELEGLVTGKAKDREELAAEVTVDEKGKSILDKYERIRKSKNGVAVVPVSRNNSCGGCNVALTKQQINDVMSSNLTLCDNCGRILYKDERI